MPPTPTDGRDRLPAAELVRHAAEAVLLALVLLAPWPFASVEPSWRFVLAAGIGLLTALWLAHTVLTRRFTFRADAVALGLFGLILLAALQLVPLPEAVVRVLSPAALEDWHFFRPDADEVLPGEADAPPARRHCRCPSTRRGPATRWSCSPPSSSSTASRGTSSPPARPSAGWPGPRSSTARCWRSSP